MHEQKKYTARDFKEHVEYEHKMSAFTEYLREIVYGGNDGIVTTFAVIAGFTGASTGDSVLTYTFLTVLLFGLANLFADGASMGLGNFLSIRANKEVYKIHKKKELHEIRTHPEFERAETIHLLQIKGFTEAQSTTLADIYQQNEAYWLEFMMKDELELVSPENDNAVFSGLVTFSSFLIFGFIPLVPYLFLEEVGQAFVGSVIATATALVLLGVLRWRASKEKFFRSTLEIVVIGGTSAVIAFIVGTFFRV